MRIFALILLTALFTISCTDKSNRYAETLERADAVVETSADSALALLATIDDTAHLGGERNEAMYYLLLNQAQYKLYLSTPTVSHLNQSIAYFKKTNDKYNLCRALYYKGMINYYGDKFTEAMYSLKEGETEISATDYHLYKYKIYEGLSRIFSKVYADNLFLRYTNLSLHEALLLPSVSYIASGYSDVYMAYGRIGCHDSATIYMKKAIPLLDKVDDRYKSTLLLNIGNMYSTDGDYAKAKDYLYKSLAYEKIVNVYSSLSEIYINEGKMDSAIIMLKKAKEGNSPITKKAIMEKYAQYYKALGNTEKAYEYSEIAKSILDSIRKSPEKNRILEIQAAYEKKATQRERENDRLIYFSLATIFLLGVAVLAYIIAKRKNKKIKAIKEKLSDKQKDLLSLQEEKETLAKEKGKLSTKLKDEQSKLKEAYETIGMGKAIYEAIRRGEPLPNDISDARKLLVSFFIVEHNDIYTGWKSQYDNLTNGDIVQLILAYLKFSDEKAALILGTGENAIRTARSRIKHKKRLE